MQIFDEIKNRGVEDVLFLSMDGVSGLEEGAKAIFPNVTVQRCIVHLIRSSIRYVPNKDYKRFKAHLKKLGYMLPVPYPYIYSFRILAPCLLKTLEFRFCRLHTDSPINLFLMGFEPLIIFIWHIPD